MKTAVIYARYSSDSQSEQSIEGQLRVCHEYAKSHDNANNYVQIHICKEYRQSYGGDRISQKSAAKAGGYREKYNAEKVGLLIYGDHGSRRRK